MRVRPMSGAARSDQRREGAARKRRGAAAVSRASGPPRLPRVAAVSIRPTRGAAQTARAAQP